MKSKGFTLVELLVVIAIIGILAASAILIYNTTQQRARDGRRKDNLNQIEKALAFYNSVNSIYPDTISFDQKWQNTEGTTTYMESVPNDPSLKFNPNYTPYQYSVSTDKMHYILSAQFERKDDAILNNDGKDEDFKAGTSYDGIVYEKDINCKDDVGNYCIQR